MKLIMENRREYQNEPQERDAFLLFERNVNEELELMINEGLLDTIATAYEKTKAGAIKMKDKVSSTVQQAIEKVNDFVLKTTIKAIEMAKSSVEGLVRAVSSLNDTIEKFRKNHPFAYKVVKIVIFMIIIFGIMTLFSSSAQASVMKPGGGQLNQEQYEAIKGIMAKWSQGDIDKSLQMKSAINMLDTAMASKKSIPVEALGKLNAKAISILQGEMKSAAGGNKGSLEFLRQMQKIGSNLTIR